uniref:Anaphase-promoting complex subunit 4 WD40 domain-containing protein n=1 Tax=Chlamydomonas euryale TaxID=1486919 RepID=A0A7R9VE69_9CHLO|mmetsp:Transcript_33145/g.98639  ORF Transcript_33145/g.98639 Transcript_33145/m.98639 type:complete len:329 (+) Transcript_33145:145-1131(+)
MQLNVDDAVIRAMGMGKVYKDFASRVNSIDFHRCEDLLVTASDDDSIRLYNTSTGERGDVFFSKKYGVQNICFTHHPSHVVYGTRKAVANDHALRYQDLCRNEYLRYYRGHSAPLNTLCLSPKTDMFMSAAQDKTVRLWDLRTNICQGLLSTPGNPVASFDQQGLVFGVGTEAGLLKLYDVRSYDKGPFDTFVVQDEVNSTSLFADIKFSYDGKYLLVTVEGKVYVLDAFNGTVVRRILNTAPEGSTPMEAVISADNKYVLQGCEDRNIRVWSIATGAEVATWPGHAGTPNCLRWSSRQVLVASACQALALWVPNLAMLESQIIGRSI